jgi:hypothetical protein
MHRKIEVNVCVVDPGNHLRRAFGWKSCSLFTPPRSEIENSNPSNKSRVANFMLSIPKILPHAGVAFRFGLFRLQPDFSTNTGRPDRGRITASWAVMRRSSARSSLAPKASLESSSLLVLEASYRWACRCLLSRRSRPVLHSLISRMRESPLLARVASEAATEGAVERRLEARFEATCRERISKSILHSGVNSVDHGLKDAACCMLCNRAGHNLIDWQVHTVAGAVAGWCDGIVSGQGENCSHWGP